MSNQDRKAPNEYDDLPDQKDQVGDQADNQDTNQTNNNTDEENANDSSFSSDISTPESERRALQAQMAFGIDPRPLQPLRPRTGNDKSPSKGGPNNHQNHHKPTDVRQAKQKHKRKMKRLGKGNLLPDSPPKDEYRPNRDEDQDGNGGGGVGSGVAV